MKQTFDKIATAKDLYENKQAYEAIAIMRELILVEPKNESHRIQLALYLRAIGNFDESLFYVDKVSKDIPGYKMLKGWHLLKKGYWNQGMQMREPEIGIYRIERLYQFSQDKKYQKGMSVNGKKILLVLEGGNGDEIAYLRFAQVLTKKGALLSVATSAPFVEMAKRAEAVVGVCALENIDHTSYDYYIPAMSMFSLFEDIENPSTDIVFPYITADNSMLNHWKPILEQAAAGKLKIGIQWQGNPEFDHVEFKTIPAVLLAQFEQFGKLFLIQRPETITSDNTLPSTIDAFNTQTDAPNWEQTLAVIDAMDVIIAGDTTITHMAGALGKKTIVLLPLAPHPYWADLHETSTWYPSVQVMRQPQYNDWEGAVALALNSFSHTETEHTQLQSDDELFKEGQKQYEARNYTEALRCIHELYKRGHKGKELQTFEAECLHYTGEAEKAEVIMRRLLEQEPQSSNYAILLSQYLRALGRFDESIKLLEQVDPSTPGFYSFYGWHQLRNGKFSEAFETLHKEINTTDITGRLALPQDKLLTKHISVKDKVVFLILDGGFGDQILSIRFAKILKNNGAKVIVGADPSLFSLFKRIAYVHDIRAITAVELYEYDYYVSAISCVEIFDLKNPQDSFVFPYLTPLESEVERLKPKIDAMSEGKTKIGIHWQGNLFFNALDMKSIPAEHMLTLSECGTLYSLQRDTGENTLPKNSDVIDLMTEPASWEYTAAAIACMDIIVTNDASVAHLAGALGKKTVVISPLVASIYWLPYQERSIWYPTVTVVYQQEYAVWQSVIEETSRKIAKELTLMQIASNIV